MPGSCRRLPVLAVGLFSPDANNDARRSGIPATPVRSRLSIDSSLILPERTPIMRIARDCRPETVADPPRRTKSQSANVPGKAGDVFPVLIRLPRLSIEPDAGRQAAMEHDESERQMTIPLTAALNDVRSSGYLPEEACRTSDKAGSMLAANPDAPPTSFPTPACARFRPPRWAVHGSLALFLFLVLAVAFSAIRQPAKKNSLEQSPSRPPQVVDVPSGISTFGAPPVAREPAAPARVVRPRPATDLAEAAQEPRTPVDPSAVVAAELGQNASKPAVETEAAFAKPQLPEVIAPTAPAESLAAGSAGPAPPPTDHSAGDRRQPEQAATVQSDLPLIGGADRETPAARHRYPVTDPATFQYPADYHERLFNRTSRIADRTNEPGAGDSLRSGPKTGGASVYGWQPNTARLQPRIEPPPVR